MKNEYYNIRLSRLEILVFAAASAIILEYSIVAYIAMMHGGVVTNYFNKYHEGWFEVFMMLGVGIYVFAKTLGSKREN